MKSPGNWIAVCILSVLSTGGAAARDWVVDPAHPAAADTGAGTREAPFKTIGAAALKTEPGDRVLVRPGVYREEVVIGVSGRPDAPIVFESEVPHAAVVTGSDPAPAGNWTEVEPGVWRAAWPAPLRLNRNGNGEWVYADGVPLLAVQTSDELLPGRFWLNFADRAVHVMLDEGRTPADTSLELAVRDGLFRPANWESSQRLKAGAPWITDIVIRGFTVVHNADWFRGFGAIRVTGERWLVENNLVRFGSRMGIQTGSTRDCVVRSNTVEWVGVTGVGGSPNLALRFENNTVRYGNFRRNEPGAEGGGSKFLGTMDGVFTGNRFEANYGSGLWFDGGNSFNTIRGNRCTDNFVFGGFFSEIGWHDFYADNVSAYNEIGFLIGETPGCVLHRNLICGNSNWGIRMRGNYRREAGMTLEDMEAKLLSLTERIPNFPPERLERRRFHMLQYLVATPYRLLNNCAIVDNLIFDNTTGYIEYRLYGTPTNRLAPFVQNFSDYNVFWPRDTNQVLFTGPAGYVYPNGLTGWQAAAERDLHSVVADPRAPDAPLPAWAKGHPFLKEPRLRLNTDLAAAGLTIVPSPETAVLYARLRRASALAPVALPVPTLRACRFTLEGELWFAVWNTEERGRRYVTLRVAPPAPPVEDAYGTRRQPPAADGRLDLGVDYRPLFLRGLTGAVTAVDGVRLDVRRFNAVGAAVPFSVELLNDGQATAAVQAAVRTGSGFRAEPAAWTTNVAAGAHVTWRGQLVPDGAASCTLARVRLDGRFGASAFARVAQFAIGEGAGTISRAPGTMRVDGRVDDWGDLAARVPLCELAEFGRDGFGDARQWSGPDDLSLRLHAAWTEQGLYWLALVRDDRPLGCPEGLQPFMADAIELFFDGRSPEMQWDPKAGEGTAQWSVSPAASGRPGAVYRRPVTLAVEHATGEWAGGYLIEGFLPFDPSVFPAGEWREGRAVKLAVHLLDRDDPEGLGINYNRGFCALGWGATRVMEKHRTTGEERPVTRTHSSTAGWKTLMIER